MKTMKERVKPVDDVVDTDLDAGEVVLLHLGSKQYFSLNATGGLIWKELKRGQTLESIVRSVQQRYEVPEEKAAASVSALIDELAKEGLVEIESG
jgi:hypothetical protein